MRRLLKGAGPYILLELLLPGGTLLTLFLLMYRSGALTALQSMPVMRQEEPQVRALLHSPIERVPCGRESTPVFFAMPRIGSDLAARRNAAASSVERGGDLPNRRYQTETNRTASTWSDYSGRLVFRAVVGMP